MAPIDTRMAALGGTVLRQPITAVIEDQEARDAAAPVGRLARSKPSWPLPMTSSRIDVQRH